MKNRALLLAALGVLSISVCTPSEDDRSSTPAPPESAAAEAAPSAVRHMPTDSEREAVLATVQAIFDALAEGDGATLRRVMHPQVLMHSVERSADGTRTVSTSTLEELIVRVEGSEAVLTERMFDPEVRISGDLAMVWTPYDFYVGDQLSHCGADALILARDAGTEARDAETGAWQIVSLSWTRLQPPECELHPDGPPRRHSSA